MNFIIYFLIFFCKILEISLGTLRMIVVSNGKKMFGAILQFVISLIWIFSTSIVLIGINKDYYKILFFAIGSFVGSLLGSYIEEKLAIGSNMITCITDDNNITDIIRKEGYAVTTLNGNGMDSSKNILMIMTSRRKIQKVVDLIKKHDKNSLIISESATAINGGYSI